MRAVPLFIAVALLGCAFAAEPQVAKAVPPTKRLPDLAAAVHKAGESLAKVQLKSPFGMRAIPQAAHLFKAQQSATCDQAAFADATARALQACPSLSGLVSGTTTMVEFLPGFCGSDCHKTLAAELPKHAGCLEEMSSAAFLLTFVKGCALRPRCFSEGFIKTQDTLMKRCSSQITAVTNFKNFSTSGIADTRSACQGTCVTEMASLMRSYPECIQDDEGNVMPAASMANLMEGLCQQENSEYCAVRLKGIGRFACSEYSVCAASGSWCSSSWYGYSYCTPSVTESRLESFCGSCVANLQKNAAAFEDDADTLVGTLNLFCSTVNGGAHMNGTNPYCYPPAMTAFASLNGGTSSNATAAMVCGGNATKCVDRIVAITADISASTAKKSFVSCLSSYSSGSSYCLSSYESSLRTAAETRAAGPVICAQNDNNDYCAYRLYDVDNNYLYCSWGYGSTYRTRLAAAITNAGCCMSYYNDYSRYDSSSYEAAYLPAGQRVQPYTYYYTGTTRYYSYTHTTRYTKSVIYRSAQPANSLINDCLGSTSNTTAFWDQVEGHCATWLVSPPSGSVAVMVSWTRLNRNKLVKTMVEKALTVDVANTIGVAAADILNGTLVQNTAATIYLRNESTLTRRQQATTDSGATFQFYVDQPTSAEATSAIARLTSAVSAGTFVTPSAAAAVTTSCGECVDARSDLLVKAAETPVAPVLTSPPSEASSARAVAVAAAVAAAFALVAAL